MWVGTIESLSGVTGKAGKNTTLNCNLLQRQRSLMPQGVQLKDQTPNSKGAKFATGVEEFSSSAHSSAVTVA